MRETTRLIITRRHGEAVAVGDAKIIVLGITGRTVRLGIEAPRNVPIVRDDAGQPYPLEGTSIDAPTQIVTDYTRTTIERPRPL